MRRNKSLSWQLTLIPNSNEGPSVRFLCALTQCVSFLHGQTARQTNHKLQQRGMSSADKQLLVTSAYWSAYLGERC
jgi:hypothetical protein